MSRAMNAHWFRDSAFRARLLGADFFAGALAVGIGIKLLSTMCLTGMSGLIRGLGEDVPVGEIIFCRNLFALVPILVWMGMRGDLGGAVRTRRIVPHIVRGTIGVASMFCSFWALGRLALIVNALGSEMLQARWRLSNDDLKAAEHTLAAARLCSDFHINEAAYRYPATLADAVDVAAALAGWTEAGRAAVVQRLQAIEVPKFPIGGNDLIQRGIRPGPALGAELERLEKEWIASDFRLGRMDLLAMVRAGS